MAAASDTVPAAGLPPPGVTPSFTDPESIGYQIILAAVLCPVFATSICSLRLYTAHHILKRFHLDDWLIIVALIFALAFSIVNLIQLGNGAGRHLWDVPLADFNRFVKLGGIGGSLTYNLSTLFIKVSILQFYQRFPSSRSFQLAVYATIFVAVGYCIPQSISWLYHCRPIVRYWDFTIPGTCIRDEDYLASAALNVATDIIILLLPIWLAFPLRLPARQKVGVICILMAGGFVCAVSIVRLAAIVSGLRDPDITWHYVKNLVWCLVEMYVGIICACLPCLKPFFQRYFPDMFAFLNPRNYASLFSLETITHRMFSRSGTLHGEETSEGSKTLAESGEARK
ncbi:hypothetical protein QBC47DRAFT_48216 [Echria macrotheca]|uniref:Rhodopsin domain-containing protein n=1 Tax=Echria macrotheca TaxID=438768 RepID=A0AAJ0B9P6_9PEZI|nr:hypothetical protein QBC47DRAFT_48216 [Echria macrotheca]